MDKRKKERQRKKVHEEEIEKVASLRRCGQVSGDGESLWRHQDFLRFSQYSDLLRGGDTFVADVANITKQMKLIID